MAKITMINGNGSSVGGAALFTATTNCRLLINFIHASGSTLTMRWGHVTNYNQVTSVDMHTIGRKLAQIYASNNDAADPYYGSYRMTRGFQAAYDTAGMTTTMAYPLELYLKSGEIFDLTCDTYSLSVIEEN